MITRRHLVQAGTAVAGAAGLGLVAQTSGTDTDLGVPRPDTVIPLSYFGTHVHDPRGNWPAFRFGQLRLWDTRTTWFNLQPEAGRWDFDRLDGIVSAAARRDVAIVMPLGMPPRWAASRADEPSPYGVLGAASEPRNLDDWQRFVTTIAQRYRGRIRTYELWNEVNVGAGFFTGSAEAMLELQRVAFEALKAVDGSITFVSPSSVGESDGQLAWFERYMGLMRGRWADVVAYHFYTPRRSPEALLPLALRVRRIAERTGSGKLPLWNSESGYRVNWGQKAEPGGTMNSWPNLAPELAAAYFVRAAVLGWAAGLDAFFSYAYENGFMGLVGPGMTSSPVTEAADACVGWLVGARLIGLSRREGVLLAELRRGSARVWLAWSEDDRPRAWLPPESLGLRAAATLAGQALRIEGAAVPCAAMPIVLAADAAALRSRS